MGNGGSCPRGSSAPGCVTIQWIKFLFVCSQRLTYRDEIHIRGCLDALVLWLYDNMLLVCGLAIAAVAPEVIFESYSFNNNDSGKKNRLEVTER